MKIISEVVNGKKCEFIISTADAHFAVHVNVKVHPDFHEFWTTVNNRTQILENLATQEAKQINSTANKLFTQVNTSIEWQGQFDFSK